MINLQYKMVLDDIPNLSKQTIYDLFIATRPLSLTLALYSTTIGATGLIGLVLLTITSKELLIVGLLGMIGSYAYTGEPIVYKKRGLGTPLSFLLMGPLMVYGAYVVFSESFSWSPIVLSLPVSLLIPALMLSNELRDFDRDKRLGIKTLTVRLGYLFGRNLYQQALVPETNKLHLTFGLILIITILL